MKILIDNGHGVNTAGKRSPDGKLLEWKYTREIARQVVKALKKEGLDAELIVPEDSDIALGERCNRVNAFCDRLGTNKVCVVSIHINAAGNGQWMNARGWEAWTSMGQTQGDILASCMYEAAREVLPSVCPDIKIRTDYSDGDPDKEENFTILKRTKCAACLTENLFMDNIDDVKLLLSPEGSKAIVKLHVLGVKKYLSLKR